MTNESMFCMIHANHGNDLRFYQKLSQLRTWI